MLGKKKNRRLSSLLAIFLALTCTLSAIPVSAYAEENIIANQELTNTDTSVLEEVSSAEDLEEEKPNLAEEASDESSGEEAFSLAEEFDGEEAYDDRINLALGCSYTGTDAFENIYPDTGHKELTDGLFGSTDYGDPNYVGYAGGNHDVELIFDFGYKQTFDEVNFQYVCSYGPGIGAPKSVAVSYSSDKLNWSDFAAGGAGDDGDEMIHTYTLTGAPATARFVKVYIKYATSWMFVSEVQIMGAWSDRDPKEAVFTTDLPTNVNKYEGDAVNLKMDYTLAAEGDEVSIVWTKDNVELPEFNDRKAIKIPNAQLEDSGVYQAWVINRFKDGSEVRSFSSASLVTIQESALGGNDPVTDVPDSDPNNLAFRKSYTLSNNLEEDYTNQGQMTDGLYGSKEDYMDGRWLGFTKAKGNTAEVVVDLGSSQSFQQIEANFLRDEIAGAEWPTTVQAFASDNGSSWRDLGSFSLKRVSTSESLICPFAEKVNGTGRYVKFAFTAGSKNLLLVDEIRVLKTSNIPDQGEQDPLPQPDLSNDIAYGKSYEYNREPNSGYPDTGKLELTDGRHGAGVEFSDPEWVGFLAVPDGAEGSEDIVVTLDLGKDEDFQELYIEYGYWSGPGIQMPDKVKIEISSDKQSWQTLVEGSGTECTGTGSVRRFSYANAEGMTGRYVRFTTTPNNWGWLFMDEVQVLKETNVIPDPYNIVRGQDYTISRLPDNGADGVLTDGRYGVTASLRDPNWVGFLKSKNEANNHVELIFNLTGMHSLSKISVYSREDAALKLTTPKNLKFYVSNDGNKWTTLKTFDKGISAFGIQDDTELTWDASDPADAFVSTEPEYVLPYTGFVKIAFDLSDARDVYTYIDEVKIIGVNVKTADAGPCLSDGFDPYNVAFNKSYTLSPEEPLNDFPDESGMELTDGVRGEYLFADPAWVGFVQAATMSGRQVDRWALKTIIVDLEEVHSISWISLSCCGGGSSGGVFSPWAVFMYASMDGENWMPLSRNSSANDATGLLSYGWHNPEENNGKSIDLTGDENSVYQARYVRVDVELKGKNLFDELEIYGVKGVTEDAKPLTNLSTLEYSQNYLRPSEETTGGVHDMVLCYNGWYGYDQQSDSFKGNWSAEKFRPYLTYVDKDGYVQDTMFDTVLLLGIWSQYQHIFNHVWGGRDEKAGPKDWEWYINKTFCEGGDVDNLNKAAKRASEELGDPNYKVKLVVMFPSIDKLVTDFGSLDGSHILDFSETADYQYAADWWIDQVVSRMESGKYEYIELEGLYEMDEQIDFRDSLQYVADKVHSYGYKYYWIPHYRSCGYLWSQDYGVDCTALQPNHMFSIPEDEYDFGAGGTKQVEQALKLASYGNIGLEMELDDHLFLRPSWYNLGLDYLNAGVKMGADGDKCYRNWYEGCGTIAQLAASNDSVMRELYDNIYQFMNGTYQPREYITEFATGDTPMDAGFNGKMFYGPSYDGTWDSIDGNGSSGSGSIGGGSSGGGSTTPSKPVDPETPPTDDENYTWEETEDGYKLKDADGEYVTGWVKVSGKWYYLNADGIRATGWQKVDNNWYYLKSDGVMATGWLKLGNTWYYLNAGGVMQTGWLYNGGIWYYLYDWGGMANDRWVKVGNTWYYFRGNGAMFTGWLQEGSTWYYLKSSGAMATGWNWVGNKCYYFYENGKMAANTTVGGYKVDASGAWVK